MDWPSNLPQEFEEDGYKDSLPSQLLYSKIDKYDEDIRRINRHEDISMITGQMYMTYIEWLEVKKWYKDVLKFGVLKFNFPNPDDITSMISVVFESTPKMRIVGYNYCIIQLSFQKQ